MFSYFATMALIDPKDANNSLVDCARQLDQYVSTTNSLHVIGDDKYTRSVECVIFMITDGRVPSIDEMTTDEYGLRSTSDIDPVDLRMSSRPWELQGLVPSGKALDHVSMHGTHLSDEKNADNMYLMFVNLPAEVITQGVSMIHVEFSKFFRAEYFNGESTKLEVSLALLRGIQQCFVDIQNRCVRATDELSILVIETASQRPATLKDFRTQELALERQSWQTQLSWELSKFESIGTRQKEIAKKFCSLQIREEGSRLNIATHNAIGFVLSLLLDPTPGEVVPTLNVGRNFAVSMVRQSDVY